MTRIKGTAVFDTMKDAVPFTCVSYFFFVAVFFVAVFFVPQGLPPGLHAMSSSFLSLHR